MTTYQDLSPADRTILALANYDATVAAIDGDQARADDCRSFFLWACAAYEVDPDETLTHL